MGRQAAGDSFLHGLSQHHTFSEIWFLSDAENITSELPPELLTKNANIVKQLTNKNIGALANSGLLYYPSPDISSLAWKRSIFGQNSWSICGITHTTSSDRIMDAIGQIPVSPVRPWDAIICTSEAVKNNVSAVIQSKLEYLVAETGATKFNLPQFPVIPLGLNTGQLTKTAERDEIRRNYNIKSDAVVVLYLGRLSFHAKANPYQMYKALSEVALGVKQEIILVECGWFSTTYISEAFENAFNRICQETNIKRVVLNGTDSDKKRDALAISDIFISLSDNIQETFGITPLEAMGSGIPVIVSDWNGYKETVDRKCGFRIPTVMPNSGLGSDIINRYALGIDDYDQYLGNVSNFVSVCQQTLINNLKTLVTNTTLRSKLGRAGAQHATSYDWSRIIPQYKTLWQELEDMRKKASSQSKIVWAERLDPYKSFTNYSSRKLIGSDVLFSVHANPAKNREELEKVLDLVLTSYRLSVTGSRKEIADVLNSVSPKGMTVIKLLSYFEDENKAKYLRIIHWLLKVDLLRTETIDTI